MDKSNENGEFEDWELIPIAKHTHTNTGNKDGLLAIDADYFSNETKVIQIVPESMNNYEIAGTKIETPKFSTENEGGDCKEDIMNPKKEKQKFWMIGALSSIGVAAVTICILGFAGKNGRNQSSRNIQFQLYTDEKRIREVVKQATHMRHALSAVRGTSTTRRARVSFGGHYDGL